MPLTELSYRTLTTVAPTVGGRTTRPCTMPGTRTLCTYSNVPGHHRGHVEALDGIAEHGPFARRLALRVRIQRQIEFLAADELAVGDRSSSRVNDAIAGGEPLDRHAPLLRRHLQQRFARRRRGKSKIVVIEILRMRLRTRRHALVGRGTSDALNQLDAIDLHAQLFGDELRLRREEALPHLALACVGGDGIVGVDGQPAVNLFWRIADQRRDCLAEYIGRSQREGNDKCAGAFREARGGTCRPPSRLRRLGAAIRAWIEKRSVTLHLRSRSA